MRERERALAAIDIFSATGGGNYGMQYFILINIMMNEMIINIMLTLVAFLFMRKSLLIVVRF